LSHLNAIICTNEVKGQGTTKVLTVRDTPPYGHAPTYQISSNDYFIKVWFQLSNWFQTRRFLCEFLIGSYVKQSSAVGGHLGRKAELPAIFLEENHPMTISSTFSSYRANGFKQEDFYGNFP
jgi:hypothetical protein